MSTSIKDGGPAFPRAGFLSEIKTPEQVISQYENKPQQGMTLRDYFAAKAMAASRSRNSSYATWKDLAEDAYEIADAMLAARKEASK